MNSLKKTCFYIETRYNYRLSSRSILKLMLSQISYYHSADFWISNKLFEINPQYSDWIIHIHSRIKEICPEYSDWNIQNSF